MPDTLLFDNWKDIGRIFIMCLLAYPFLIFLLRAFGKRSLATVNMFDFIITVAYGASFASIVLTPAISFAEGAFLLLLLTALQFFVAHLETRFEPVASLVKAKPLILYQNGQFSSRALKKQRLRKEDVHQAVRSEGLASYEKVEAIVLEGDGSFSVIKTSDSNRREALEGIAWLE